ncbi:hypothetical protein D9M73_271850 [compost metagenome]
MIRKILADIQGVSDFTPSVECAQFDTIRRVVMRSDAVGIATMEALAEWLEQGATQLLRFTDIPLEEPALRLHYGVVSKVGHSLTPAAQAMIDAIVKVDQRLADT